MRPLAATAILVPPMPVPRRRSALVVAVLVVAVLAAPAAEGTATVAGTVRAHVRRPLAGAAVVVAVDPRLVPVFTAA